jgi:hypothetical protein
MIKREIAAALPQREAGYLRGHAGAFDPVPMHDGTDHEPTHHGAALMMQGQKQRDGTRNDNIRNRVAQMSHRYRSTIAAGAKDKHDRVITVSDINDRYSLDDADEIEIKQAMDSTSIALVPVDLTRVAANIMRDRYQGEDFFTPPELVFDLDVER